MNGTHVSKGEPNNPEGDEMLYELDPQDYERARPLFARWRAYLVIFAVLDGTCPGRVYVDDREHPRTALLWDHAEG